MASDPEKGITFYDFVAVQWKVLKGGKKEDLKTATGEIPPPGILMNCCNLSVSPLEEAFVKSVKAYDVKGIKVKLSSKIIERISMKPRPSNTNKN